MMSIFDAPTAALEKSQWELHDAKWILSSGMVEVDYQVANSMRAYNPDGRTEYNRLERYFAEKHDISEANVHVFRDTSTRSLRIEAWGREDIEKLVKNARLSALPTNIDFENHQAIVETASRLARQARQAAADRARQDNEVTSPVYAPL